MDEATVLTVVMIFLYLCPLIAVILFLTRTKYEMHWKGIIILLSIAFLTAILVAVDYLSCSFAYAVLSPILRIEYSYDPHDAMVGAAFANLIVCPIGIIKCIVEMVRKPKKENDDKIILG